MKYLSIFSFTSSRRIDCMIYNFYSFYSSVFTYFEVNLTTKSIQFFYVTLLIWNDLINLN